LSDPTVAAAVKTVIDRLQLELRVIEKTDFISYFLIVGDFVRFGRNKGIACVARGSAAGSSLRVHKLWQDRETHPPRIIAALRSMVAN